MVPKTWIIPAKKAVEGNESTFTSRERILYESSNIETDSGDWEECKTTTLVVVTTTNDSIHKKCKEIHPSNYTVK